MPRAVIGQAIVLMSLVAVLGGTAAGQGKPTTRKPAAKTAEKSVAISKPATVASDLAVRTRFTSGAQASENMTYVKGARQRVEFPGAVTIEQCDLRRMLLINPTSKTYLVQSRGEAGGEGASTAGTVAPDSGQAATSGEYTAGTSKGGVITYTTTVADTGERKQLFGREARRITTVITKQASASACDKSAMTVEVDGWYVDVQGPNACSTGSAPAHSVAPKPDACVDRIEMRTSGDAKPGFPVAVTTTMKIGEGDNQVTTTSSMEVTSLEVTTLDSALFDVPAGYTQVGNNSELMSGFQATGGLSKALLGSTADGTSAAAPKSAGAIRLGVLEPVDKSTRNLATSELRQQLAAHLQKAPFEALTLAGSGVAESREQAERLQCDYVLYSEIADIKTSKPGKLGGMLKRVTRESPAREVHEVKLAYRLYRVGAEPTAPPAFADNANATSGGGFDLHAALRVAAFAGSTYLRFSGLSLLSPMLMSQFGGGLGSLSGAGVFDPRTRAMSSMTQLLDTSAVEAMGGNGAATMPVGTAGSIGGDAEIRQTVDNALANAAKGTMEQLKKNNRK